jgi:hypothetical protein
MLSEKVRTELSQTQGFFLPKSPPMRPTTVAAQDDLLGRITEAISLLSAQIISHENLGNRVDWRAL